MKGPAVTGGLRGVGVVANTIGYKILRLACYSTYRFFHKGLRDVRGLARDMNIELIRLIYAH